MANIRLRVSPRFDLRTGWEHDHRRDEEPPEPNPTLKRFLESPEHRRFGDERASSASLVVVLTSALYRSCLKYAGRGYRYALIEVGAVAQSIDLCCRAEGLGVCWLGGFADRAVAELLDVSWELELEAPILCLAIGPPPV